MGNKTWFSTKEAADILNVSQRTVQNWVDQGKLQSIITAGGHRRILREEVTRFLLKQNSGSFSQFDQPTSNGNQLRVLVVDDDLALLRLCELRFSQFRIPHQLFLASNAFEGLIMVGRHQPHVIFTDIRMPGVDGLQMLKAIINLPDVMRTHIVTMTGLDAQHVMELGGLPDGVQLLPKPIPFNTVEMILYQQAQALESVNKHP